MAAVYCTECGTEGCLAAGEVNLPCGHSKGFYLPLDDSDRDKRTPMEKFLWEKIGPPLYYCAECLRAVKVTPVESAEPIVKRPCEGCNGQIIAPRKAVCVGKGGMNLPTRLRVAYDQAKAAITGRCA